MGRHQVPQFLEIEDKIFGPLTFKQFLYLGGGAGLAFLAWTILPNPISIIVGAPLLIFFVALAFYKVNDRPFIFLIENMFKFLFSKKLYLWKKENKKPEKKKEDINKLPMVAVPKLSDSKLRDLSWELDVHESLEAPDQSLPDQNNESIKDKFKF